MPAEVEAVSARRCTHIIKKTGERCKRIPLRGADVCSTPGHGGALPRVKAAAKFRVANAEAQEEALKRIRKNGTSAVDAIRELERIGAEAVVFKDVARERFEELWALGEIRYQGQTGEQLRAEIALYERALTSCSKMLSDIVKLGIAEKRAELDKATALLTVGVIRAILNRLDLTPEQQRTAVQVVPQEMMAVSSALAEEPADAELA